VVADRFERAVTVAVTVLACVFVVSGCAVFGGSSASSSDSAKPTNSTSDSPSQDAPSSTAPSGGKHSTDGRHGKVGKVLAGKIVGIDPGHNGLNHTDPGFLGQQVFNGRTMEDCDTTGTQTASGYTEALFNFTVAVDLRAMLRREGAKVVMTRKNNDGLGPCVDRRAKILDDAHANVSIDIHADGGPASGRGFTVLEPLPDGPNDKVISSSDKFGSFVHQAFLADTPFGVSDYYAHGGYISRDDLAGLNLTTMPKVLIECGNMPNPQDAALLTSPKVQKQIARALNAAIVRFLTGHWPPGTS
jgi:N-acetylmuramoyl-L-alanine amidase